MTRTHALIIGGAAVVLAGGIIHWWSQPSNPTPQTLAKSGIIIKPLSATEPVGPSMAEKLALATFPKLPKSTATAIELVTFKNPQVFTLKIPKPAWIVTWNQKSFPQGPWSTSPYTRMNVVISAKSGSILEIFPSL